jgi:hypothetical protein
MERRLRGHHRHGRGKKESRTAKEARRMLWYELAAAEGKWAWHERGSFVFFLKGVWVWLSSRVYIHTHYTVYTQGKHMKGFQEIWGKAKE